MRLGKYHNRAGAESAPKQAPQQPTRLQGQVLQQIQQVASLILPNPEKLDSQGSLAQRMQAEMILTAWKGFGPVLAGMIMAKRDEQLRDAIRGLRTEIVAWCDSTLAEDASGRPGIRGGPDGNGQELSLPAADQPDRESADLRWKEAV